MHPEIPEGINVSKTHPLAEFGFLIAAAAIIIVIVLLVAQVIAGAMVRHISFESERALFQQLVSASMYQEDDEYPEKTAYLQALAEQLVVYMELPDGMQVDVHYSPDKIANAYATLGGNIVIYQGMIDQVSSENGLAMVLAHEIAHIKNRDPVMALGRGTVSLIGLAILSGFGDSSAMSSIVNITGSSLLSKFSRDQESQADEEAVNAMLGLYGTTQGADEFFVSMSEQESSLGAVFFSTHPATDKRIERIERSIDSSAETELMPLSPVFSNTAETN